MNQSDNWQNNGKHSTSKQITTSSRLCVARGCSTNTVVFNYLLIKSLSPPFSEILSNTNYPIQLEARKRFLERKFQHLDG